MNIKRNIGEIIRISDNLLGTKEYEKGHKLNLPIKDSSICYPNSVFKLEMLTISKIQAEFIEVLSLLPLSQKKLDVHSWDAYRIREDCIKKLGKYGFENFVEQIKRTVSTKCKSHNGECVLMNCHSYVKIMEVIYTAYITNIQPSDIVMNLAGGNTYWANVWLANQCEKLYANDNGFYVPIHDKDKQVFNYNEYQKDIYKKVEFADFDASKTFPYSDNMFDKIVSHSSVEHIDNWDTNVLPEILRTLKPKGKCGLASVYHPLGRENLSRGQSSWWTNKKWERFVGLQDKLGFEIIGNTDYEYGMPWRAEEDTDNYRFKGSVYIVNFIFFRKI
jgi:SAM-dependent methyltransferase